MRRAVSAAVFSPRRSDLNAVPMRFAAGPIDVSWISPSMNKNHGSLLAGFKSDRSSFGDIAKSENWNL